MNARAYRDWLGGDEVYEWYRLQANHHVPVGAHSSIGLRVDTETIGGRAPFFAYPFVKQRGIPAMRYQGETVANAWSVGLTMRFYFDLIGLPPTPAQIDDSVEICRRLIRETAVRADPTDVVSAS